MKLTVLLSILSTVLVSMHASANSCSNKISTKIIAIEQASSVDLPVCGGNLSLTVSGDPFNMLNLTGVRNCGYVVINQSSEVALSGDRGNKKLTQSLKLRDSYTLVIHNDDFTEQDTIIVNLPPPPPRPFHCSYDNGDHFKDADTPPFSTEAEAVDYIFTNHHDVSHESANPVSCSPF